MTIEIYSRIDLINKTFTGWDRVYDEIVLISFHDNDIAPINLPCKFDYEIYAGLVDFIPGFEESFESKEEADEFIEGWENKRKSKSKEIAEIIHNLKSKNTLIICQCEMGQSRSSGAAAALYEYFFGNGKMIFDDVRYSPNPYIYKGLLKALNEN